MNWDNVPVVAGISDYLHWLVHTKYKKPWRLEAELAAQYSREHGFAVAYVGWERELGKRRVKVTMEQLLQAGQGTTGPQTTDNGTLNGSAPQPSSGLQPPSPAPAGEGQEAGGLDHGPDAG